MQHVEDIFSLIEVHFPHLVSRREIKRSQFLIREGERENYSHRILEGAIIVVLPREKKDQIIRFGYKGSILTSLPAFFDDSPSQFDMIAIRKTKMISYHKSSFDLVAEKFQNFDKAYRKILEGLIGEMIEREIDLLTSDPIERYHRLLQRSPQVFQEIPAHYVANYLKMTPEHLSRVRNS